MIIWEIYKACTRAKDTLNGKNKKKIMARLVYEDRFGNKLLAKKGQAGMFQLFALNRSNKIVRLQDVKRLASEAGIHLGRNTNLLTTNKIRLKIHSKGF